MTDILPATDVQALLRNAMEDFAKVLATADVGLGVPNCPGWKVRDLAVHLGTIHRWAASVLLGGRMIPEPEPIIEKPLHEWYRSTGAALLAAIEAVAPNEPVPNFARIGEKASFWPRRQLHEVTVHLLDLTRTLSLPDIPVPLDLAADGVEEVLTVFFRRLAGKGTPPDLRGCVRIRATDTGDEWIPDPGSVGQLCSLATRCEATISGSASDLYFVLWGRLSPDRVEASGEAAVALLAGRTSV